jgi:dTMP kinase
MRKRRGFLLSVEGVDGSGKSTQIRRIHAYLLRQGVEVTLVREPGGTALSERIRRWLLVPGPTPLSPPSELYLYLAARGQVFAEVIRPALERNGLVLCDRFTDSTLAYQGFGRGLSPDLLRRLNDLATESRRPDLTLFLDVPLSLSARRRGRRPDRIEREKARFFERVRSGYLQIARDEPRRFVRVDGSGARELVFERIRIELDRVLKRLS